VVEYLNINEYLFSITFDKLEMMCTSLFFSNLQG